ncbi:putative nuclear transcription factor Y subunit B-6-like [Capsicum annuum]|uniref:BHLH domain-containing protein n=1 Tax=Capsicum annuum TaxID=4072 RepID=A0A2G2ZPB4_CAPAN|nr:putative nuclear transcription factor Y subunit B-6-like [Capsicum annuum]PHT83830.1 hypothetical protein T459_12273 [Capsicum annuum]
MAKQQAMEICQCGLFRPGCDRHNKCVVLRMQLDIASINMRTVADTSQVDKNVDGRLTEEEVREGRLHLISQVSESSANPSIQGSSTGSTPSDERTLCHSPCDHLSQNIPLSQSTEGYFEHTELQCGGNLSRMEGSAFPWKQENYIVAGDMFVMGKKIQKGPYQSKNLVTERKRRNRIKDGMLDKVAILGDAIDYINELQEQVKLYVTELNEIEAEVTNSEAAEMVLSDMTEMSKVLLNQQIRKHKVQIQLIGQEWSLSCLGSTACSSFQIAALFHLMRSMTFKAPAVLGIQIVSQATKSFFEHSLLPVHRKVLHTVVTGDHDIEDSGNEIDLMN